MSDPLAPFTLPKRLEVFGTDWTRLMLEDGRRTHLTES